MMKLYRSTLSLACFFCVVQPFLLFAQTTIPIPSVWGSNERVLFISGADAPISLGDSDHRQVILFKLPDKKDGLFNIKILDPWTHDSSLGWDEKVGREYNTRTRFRLIGGKIVEEKHLLNGYIQGGEEELLRYGIGHGNLLLDQSFSSVTPPDAQSLEVDLGGRPVSLKDGFFYQDDWWFLLVVEGTHGDDGNAYQIRVTEPGLNGGERPFANMNFAYLRLCFRLNPNQPILLMPHIPSGANRLLANVFDHDDDSNVIFTVADSVDFSYPERGGEGTWKTMRLKLSQNDWRRHVKVQFPSNGNLAKNNVEVFFQVRAGATFMYNLPIYPGGANPAIRTVSPKPKKGTSNPSK